MEKLYRKVNCSDRMPKENKECFTDTGLATYLLKDNQWYYVAFLRCNPQPDWWLEEIQLPNDEEIESQYCMTRYESPDFDWMSGAKWMRDLILKTK